MWDAILLRHQRVLSGYPLCADSTVDIIRWLKVTRTEQPPGHRLRCRQHHTSRNAQRFAAALASRCRRPYSINLSMSRACRSMWIRRSTGVNCSIYCSKDISTPLSLWQGKEDSSGLVMIFSASFCGSRVLFSLGICLNLWKISASESRVSGILSHFHFLSGSNFRRKTIIFRSFPFTSDPDRTSWLIYRN